MQDSKQQQIQSWAARKLGIDEVPSNIWKELWTAYEDIVTVAWATEEDEAVKDFLRIARSLLRVSSERGGSTGRNRDKVFTPQLAPRDLERGQLFEAYLAMVATNTPRVQTFRDKVLAGELLSEEEAYAFLTSPLTRCCSLNFLEAWKVPPVGHTFSIDKRELEREDAWTRGVSVSIDPPDITRTIRLRPDTKGYLPTLIFPSKEVPGKGRHAESVGVGVGSVLDDLRKLSEKLAKWYPWALADATWFVLTGEPPPVPPAKGAYRVSRRGSQYTYGRIVITAMPWVPPETVLELYRKVQLHALGGDNQPIREKTRKLMRFIIDSVYLENGVYPVGLSREERRKLGKRLVAEWDQTEWVRKIPKWAYGKNTRRFWRDFTRALRVLANQPLRNR